MGCVDSVEFKKSNQQWDDAIEVKSAIPMQYFITGGGPLRSEETQRVGSMHFAFIFLSCFLVKDQEEIGDFSKIENQGIWVEAMAN